jgi:hypothetical protein
MLPKRIDCKAHENRLYDRRGLIYGGAHDNSRRTGCGGVQDNTVVIGGNQETVLKSKRRNRRVSNLATVISSSVVPGRAMTVTTSSRHCQDQLKSLCL